MAEKNKKADEILVNRSVNVEPGLISGFEGEDDSFYEGDGMIEDGDFDDCEFDDEDLGDALDSAIEEVQAEKDARTQAMKDKASKKRKVVNETKKKLGIRKGKQSKFNSRSHSFLGESQSDRAIHIVLNQHRTEIYKDGADIAPRILMGIPGFGNTSKKNAFEHLITIQEKIRENRGDNPANAPKWIIISNDTSIILDRNLISYLEELRPNTHAAAPYGFQEVRASGRWYDIEGLPAHNLRGCYVQGSMYNNDWNFIVGAEYNSRPKTRVMIGHGPFIAIRGETFMQIDFSGMAENCKSGFFHYMADISMECASRGLLVAQVKALSWQYDNITSHRDEEDLLNDQSYFTSKWQRMLPISIFN